MKKGTHVMKHRHQFEAVRGCDGIFERHKTVTVPGANNVAYLLSERP